MLKLTKGDFSKQGDMIMVKSSDSNSISEKLASNFSIYDTFGYIIPGAFFLIGIALFLEIIGFNATINLKQYFDIINNSWPAFFSTVPILFLIIYVLGHFIASISAVLIDKFLIERMFGYPFQRLFNKILDYEKSDVLMYFRKSQLIYRSLIVIAVSAITFNIMNMQSISNVFWFLFFLLLISKFFFSWFTLSELHDPYSAGQNLKDDKYAQYLWDYFLRWVTLPFYVIFNTIAYGTLSLLFRMCKPFEKEVQEHFSKLFEETFGLSLEKAGTNVYWFTYSYLQQKDEKNTLLIQNWLNLYGFSRNLCIVFLMLFILGLYPEIIFNNADKSLLNKWCFVTGICTIIFGLRYYYLYYNYYSKYIFRAFLTLKTNMS